MGIPSNSGHRSLVDLTNDCIRLAEGYKEHNDMASAVAMYDAATRLISHALYLKLRDGSPWREAEPEEVSVSCLSDFAYYFPANNGTHGRVFTVQLLRPEHPLSVREPCHCFA